MKKKKRSPKRQSRRFLLLSLKAPLFFPRKGISREGEEGERRVMCVCVFVFFFSFSLFVAERRLINRREVGVRTAPFEPILSGASISIMRSSENGLQRLSDVRKEPTFGPSHDFFLNCFKSFSPLLLLCRFASFSLTQVSFDSTSTSAACLS